MAINLRGLKVKLYPSTEKGIWNQEHNLHQFKDSAEQSLTDLAKEDNSISINFLEDFHNLIVGCNSTEFAALVGVCSTVMDNITLLSTLKSGGLEDIGSIR